MIECPHISNGKRCHGVGKRIHIVGISPRTGTSLMFELMVNGFDLDGAHQHEKSVFDAVPESSRIFCSKKPSDLEVASSLLRIDPDLWFICMIRDPRDVIVSRHGNTPDKYWTNLRLWNRRFSLVQELVHEPNFVIVRYEHLVEHPEEIQEMLLERIPFLTQRAPFSGFHRTSAPPAGTLDALGSLRPIDTQSIGSWRHHKPRVAAQIEIHGSIDEGLIYLGYEQDLSWKRELDDVESDNGESVLPEYQGSVAEFRRWIGRQRRVLRYRRRVRQHP